MREEPPAPPPPRPDLVVDIQRELEFSNVEPETAQVWLDGALVGTVEDLELLVFHRPGTYYVRFVHPGRAPLLVEVRVSPQAREEAHELELELR